MPTGSRSVGSKPSSPTPRAARPTHTRSRVRLDITTASTSGPANSMVTARPRGIRAKDW